MAKIKMTGIKGMNDMLPDEAAVWEKFEDTARSVAASYGYRQIRTPILEATGLFARGVGEATDIVEKEMYSFTDSMNGEQLTLRPEGTSAVCRCAIEHNITYNAPQRLWYFGPMFRHERPQRGRYRQFFQFGCEALGFDGPDTDIELLALTARLWKKLGITAHLQLNSLGAADERARHREALVAYFNDHYDVLDEDSRRRLTTNPLRILDTKNPEMQAMVEGAPRLLDFLGEDSRRFLGVLEAGVQALGIDYTINSRLVRGLDYYNHTVFEWVTDQLGSQGTICGGGRYDPLVEMLGGRPAPGVGFAMGMERVIELMREVGQVPKASQTDVYVLHHGGESQAKAMLLAETMRDRGIRVVTHPGEASIKSQMKKADASGAEFAVFATEDELAQGTVGIKALRAHEHAPFAEQTLVATAEAADKVAEALAALHR